LIAPSSVKEFLTHIIKEKLAVIKSQYTNFNIAFVNWLTEELSKEMLSVCVAGDYEVLDFAQRMCKNELLNNRCGDDNYYSMAIVLSRGFAKAHKVKAERVVHIVMGKESSCCWSKDGLEAYTVRKANNNVYTIRNCKKLAEYYIVQVNACTLLDYQLPHEVVDVYAILCEVVEVSGSSIKASDFLRYLVKVKGFNRESALKAIELAIKLNLIKYSGGYLTPL
jgi:hypothetical protein